MQKHLVKVGFIIFVTLVLLEASLWGVSFYNQKFSRGSLVFGNGEYRILVIGDSNAFGLFLPVEKTWPFLLSQHLKKESCSYCGNVSVMNMGYPGNTTEVLARNIEKNLEIFRPDMVLSLVGANDFWAGSGVLNGMKNEEGSGVSIKKLKVYQLARVLWINYNLPVGDGYFVAGERWEGQGIQSKAVYDETLRKIQQAEKEGKGLRSYKNELGILLGPPTGKKTRIKTEESLRNFQHIADKVHASGAVYIAIDYPSVQIFYPAASNLIHQASSIKHQASSIKHQASSIKHQANFPVISVTKEFQSHCKGKMCLNLLFYDQHMNEEGSRLFTQILVKNLLSLPL